MSSKKKWLIIYIVIGLVALGLFFLAFSLLRGKIKNDIGQVEKEVKQEETSKSENETDLEETQYISHPRKYVPLVSNTAGRSRVIRYYEEHAEDLNKQRKIFLGDHYEEVSKVLSEIREEKDSVFSSIPEVTLKEEPSFIPIGDASRNVIPFALNPRLDSTEADNTDEATYIKDFSFLKENGNDNYSLLHCCSVIDYYDDTCVVYITGYKDNLVSNYIIVSELKNATVDSSYPPETIRVGDSEQFVKLYKDSYIEKNIGDYHVIFAKTPEI